MIQEEMRLELNIRQNRQQVEDNYFPTDRGLRRRTKMLPMNYRTSYLNVFGNYFFEKLKALKSSDNWINIGGGELFAEAEYLSLDEFRKCEHARIVVISAQLSDTDDFKKNYEFLKRNLGERFVYMHGRRIEDVALEELPKASLVTDLYAATGFSEHIDQTLQKELDLLEIGGTFFTTVDKVFIQDCEGRKIGRRKYVAAIKGTMLMDIKTRFNPIILEKTEEDVIVPRLDLVEFLSYENVQNPKNLPQTMLNCERYYILGR